MKWLMMILFFFYNVESAFAGTMAKSCHVSSLPTSSERLTWAKGKAPVEPARLGPFFSFGVQTHRKMLNVDFHCDLLKSQKTLTSERTTATDMEDL